MNYFTESILRALSRRLLPRAVRRALVERNFWFKRRRTGEAAVPVNRRKRDLSGIDNDVSYALQVGTAYLGQLASFGVELSGCRILEIGPGINFGPQLLLASHGAIITLADRFLAPWDNEYHPECYSRLRSKWTGPTTALDRVLKNGSYQGTINCVAEPAESMPSVADSSFDVVLSNAVLEHVYDMPAVCRSMGRVTRVGGLNMHQIDMRDHRDFSRPHEFLLMSDEEFRECAEAAQMEFGNRWRLRQIEELFRQVGFAIEKEGKDPPVDPGYLTDFVRRLRASSSAFRDTPIADLEYGSCHLVMRRVQGSG